MSNQNMAIWEKVSKTDAAFTKRVSQRGGFTAIDATYQQMKATEMFGPYGSGWGLKEVNYDYTLFEATRMVMCHAVFFYIQDGKENCFPISNAISAFIGKERADEDFCKKLETNTISKALSRLGFSADVFMGMFDDANYVAQIQTEQAIEKAEDRDAEIKKKREEISEYVVRHLKSIEDSKTQNEIKGLAKTSLLHLNRKKAIGAIADICEKGINSISIASEKRLQEIAQ